MEETKELHCSECGAKIEDNYYKCLDNCLQVNFFSIARRWYVFSCRKVF